MKEKFKILIVDDEEIVRSALRDILEKENYCAVDCEDGFKALEMMSKEFFNLVIADLKMPGMDGNTLLTEIKNKFPSMEVILMSGYGTIDVATECMKKGAYDFVTKPINFDNFLSTVSRCIEKHALKAENLELKERLAILNVSDALVSIFDLNKLLNIIMDSINKVIRADRGSIMLLDDKRNNLTVKASFGLEGIIPNKSSSGNKKGPAWKVIEEEKPVIIVKGLETNSLFKDMKSNSSVNSSMLVPLKIKKKVLGVINLTRTKSEIEFDQRDLSLLTIFSGQAAAAIENAYLYKKLEDYNNLIKQEKEEIEAILENISDGIIVCNAEDEVVLFNPYFKNLFKLDNETILNKSFSSIFHEKKFNDLSRFILEFNKSNNNFIEKKFNLSIDDENIHLRMTIVKMNSPNKKDHKIIAFEDLTKFIQTQKVAAWQGMARGLAHEVKNPLSPILWAAEGILEKKSGFIKKDQDYIEKKCTTIINEVNRLQTLITEFSSFAKHPELDLKPFSIEKVLQETLSLYSNLPNIKIITRFQEKFPLLKIDANMMKQVFINLSKNAVEAMPDGGELFVECKVLSAGIASISFKDTGVGIPDNIAEQLFDPYFTTKKDGTGIGLTITSKIVSDHHGKVRVLSKENKGTTIIINLPIL